ncbi:MAG: PatB family C-S lyase [Bacteroidales bacterium]|nr:PatB family C-S lyase [Bacteroidales bacterium]
MSMQNFDELINREGTSSYKYDLRKSIFGTDDLYPMWVADTEFRAPGFVLERLQQRINHGILGYTITTDAYYKSIIHWLEKKHNWGVKKSWIKYSPGVVPSLFASVLAFTNPGEKVIVQTPVYHPFYYAIEQTGRQLVKNPLVLKNGRYEMDFDDLLSKIDSKVKLIFLCSPHNPTGNVWKKNELERFSEICLANNIIIISDEIHADIVYKPNLHIPLASLSDEISANTITLMAPSKTFNIAGLNSSYIVSSNKNLLDKINYFFEGMHIGPNLFAPEATIAAYENGLEWLEQLTCYFMSNINTATSFFEANMGKLNINKPEGTFLLWLDFRKYNLPQKQINEILIKKAKTGLSDGTIFGAEGEGFQRMNIGCPASLLKEALNSIAGAFRSI